MFTGRWPHELTADVAVPLDSTYPTIAEHLAGRGYRTGGFTGNTVYTNAWLGVDRGFAHYEDTEENKTLLVRDLVRSSALGHYLAPWGSAWDSGRTTATGPLASVPGRSGPTSRAGSTRATAARSSPS